MKGPQNLMKPYKCIMCDISYSYKTDLNEHKVVTHKMLLPNKCGICSSGFFGTQELLEHVSSSHVINENQLEHNVKQDSVLKNIESEETFTQSQRAKIQERTNTGEKPYDCRIESKCYICS